MEARPTGGLVKKPEIVPTGKLDRENARAPEARYVQTSSQQYDNGMGSHSSIRNTSFVLTGTMWKDRASIFGDIRRAGGIEHPGLVTGTDYLVQADNDFGRRITSKVTKAQRYGTKVIAEASLKAALYRNIPLPI